ADRGNRLAGRHGLTDLFEQTLVIGVDAQVLSAVVENENVAESVEPVGIDHPACRDRLDLRALARAQHDSAPYAAIGPLGAETALYFAAYRVGQAPAQPLQGDGGGGLGLGLSVGGGLLCALALARLFHLLAGLTRGFFFVAARLLPGLLLAQTFALSLLRLRTTARFLYRK